MGGKTGFDKLAERLDKDTNIKVIGQKVATPEPVVKEEPKEEAREEEKEKQFQWTVMLPERYKKIIRDLRYVTDRSYKDLALEALDILQDKYLAGK